MADLTAVTAGTAVEGAVEHDPSPETDAGLHGGEGGDPTSLPEPLFGQRLGTGVVLDPHRQSGRRGNLARQAVADGTRDVDGAEHLAGDGIDVPGAEMPMPIRLRWVFNRSTTARTARSISAPSDASEIGTSSA